MRKNDFETIKIAILGARGVGKSALVVRFLTRRFITEYANGSDTVYTHKSTIKGKPIRMKVIDRGSNKTDIKEILQWADGFVLVYSITQKESLEEVRYIKNEIKKLTERKPMIIVGNKADMKDKRQIGVTEARQFCNESDCLLFEVSVAEDIEPIIEIFENLARKVMEQRKYLSLDFRESVSRTPENVRKIFHRLRRRTETI